MRLFSLATPLSTSIGGLLLAATFLGACDGGDGDPPSKPLANQLGSCGRLAKTIKPATWVDPKDSLNDTCAAAIPPDRSVCLSGLTVVAIDTFDETGDGKSSGNYYVEDTAADLPPYAGVTIYRPSFSPPDLRLAEGDVVDFLGSFQEFAGPSGPFGFCHTLPELSGALSFRFDNNHPLLPKVIPLEDLKSYETGRPHLGTLVKILNVQLGPDGPSSSSGRYSAKLEVGAIQNVADVPAVTNELYDLKGQGPMLTGGASFKSITGVVTFFYGFHIAPRSAADFEL